MSLFRTQARAASDLLTERLALRTSGAGSTVTTTKALTSSAVWASLRLRADLISTMPVDVYRKVGGVSVEVPKPAVLVNPGGERVDITEWLYSTQVDLDSSGNAFGLITARDGMNLPARIELVPLADVVVQVRDSLVSYRIGGTKYEPEMVWHERQFTSSGSPVGLSPMASAAASLNSYLSAQEFTRAWFSGNGIPAAMLKNTAKTIDPTQAKAIRTRFEETVQSGGLFVTGQDWDYEMIAAKASEATAVDSLRWGVADAARFFGVPGDMIDAEVSSGSITYANVTQRNLQLLIMNIGPAIKRREVALSSLVSRPRVVKLNANALLRMDLKSRYEAHKIGTGGRPFIAPSEVRALEDLPPFTPEQLAELATITAAPAAPTVGGIDGPSAE